MHIKKLYKVRQIADENIIVEQGATQADMTKVISLNTTSLLLWNELLDREFTLADVASVLISHFGIDPIRAETDARNWIDSLVNCDIIAE